MYNLIKLAEHESDFGIAADRDHKKVQTDSQTLTNISYVREKTPLFFDRVLVQERGFLVLIGMPRLVLGGSCATSLKDFAIFPPHQKKKCPFV